VRFEFIEAQKAQFPVTLLCRVMRVSRSGFYAWRGRPAPRRAIENEALGNRISEIHERTRGAYGVPRVHAELKEQGLAIGRNRVARIMCGRGLSGRRKRPFRITTDSKHSFPIAPNLLERDFTAATPNRVWVTDMTYILTREGWLYLAAIIDLFSRRVVGWSMSDRIDTQLAISALQMALKSRKPERGLVHHSDRGCQYASEAYQRVLRANGIVGSMSRKGDCWDNAVAESFFGSLKNEWLLHADFKTRKEARSAVFEYIEGFYNLRRRHSHNGFRSPAQREGDSNFNSEAA
jgi:transposase InsO family protein